MSSDNQFKAPPTNTNINFLTNLRLRNVNKLIIGNLNINSLANKFEQLKILIQGNVDILVVTETKLDSTFPTAQFLIDGYSKPYRWDRNRYGGGVIIYVREDIPNKILNKHSFPLDWLLLATYHPPNQQDSYYFNIMINFS